MHCICKAKRAIFGILREMPSLPPPHPSKSAYGRLRPFGLLRRPTSLRTFFASPAALDRIAKTRLDAIYTYPKKFDTNPPEQQVNVSCR